MRCVETLRHSATTSAIMGIVITGKGKGAPMHRSRLFAILSLLVVTGAFGPLSRGQDSLLIAPGDLLHIQVADTPEMDEDARVTDQGMVPIVGIGDVKVAGLTPSDAATVVHDKLIDSHY